MRARPIDAVLEELEDARDPTYPCRVGDCSRAFGSPRARDDHEPIHSLLLDEPVPERPGPLPVKAVAQAYECPVEGCRRPVRHRGSHAGPHSQVRKRP